MGANVLIGVTGCIAAYKTCELIRALQNKGHDVRVVATEAALKFVGETTFDALTGHQTLYREFDDPAHPIAHIELAKWCDIFAIVPCTGNTIAKIANGIADDLLSSSALAAYMKLLVAPSMNVNMYDSPATQANLETLHSRGVRIVDPSYGRLACGDVGRGHIANIDDIVKAINEELNARDVDSKDSCLAGKKILITAGPTVEKIDDVRFISNRSSGKMGYALADQAAKLGSKVTLISGPVALKPPLDIDVIHVESADQMLKACKSVFPDCDIAICTAAVSDFRPKYPKTGKLKKAKDDAALENIAMIENADILKTLASTKRDDQIVLGFAAETENHLENAKLKLKSKGADMIIVNDVSHGQTFGSEEVDATIITNAHTYKLGTLPKSEAARIILQNVCDTIESL